MFMNALALAMLKAGVITKEQAEAVEREKKAAAERDAALAKPARSQTTMLPTVPLVRGPN